MEGLGINIPNMDYRCHARLQDKLFINMTETLAIYKGVCTILKYNKEKLKNTIIFADSFSADIKKLIYF